MFILEIPLFFYKEDPNKIEITTIGSLAGVEQGAGRGTAAFRWGGSPAVDRRWGRSFRGSRRFTRATWRGPGRPEGRVPTTTRDGDERELDGEVDAGLKGGIEGLVSFTGTSEAAGGAGVDRVEVGRAVHGGNGARRRRRSSGTNVREC
jgi:hypothetical protein